MPQLQYAEAILNFRSLMSSALMNDIMKAGHITLSNQYNMHVFTLQPQMEAFLEQQTGLLAAIRIGSAGRQQLKPNSDLDYQLILRENYESDQVLQAAKMAFGPSLARVLNSPDTDKATLFFGKHLLSCELFFHRKEDEVAKYFLCSEVTEANQAILFDRSGKLEPYLQTLINDWEKNRTPRLGNEAKRLIEAFEIRFEACSRAHGRSDGYRFSVLFGHALNALVRLVWLAQGENKFDFMPPNFLTQYSHPLGLGLDRLGPIDLRTAHFQKNHLLGLFAEWAPKAASRFDLEIDWQGKLEFLNAVMTRDRFWNLRDAAKFNNRLQPGQVFRSAAFCLMHPAEDVRSFFQQNDIRAVVDLRADRELEEHPYSPEQLGGTKHIHAPFDPWVQPEHFKKEHAHLTDNSMIAYHFFMKCCQDSVAKAFTALAETDGAVLVHCHAGKDRTGIVLTLLHLLCGANEHTARLDYLASEMDTRPELFQVILQVIGEKGGISSYLKSCGVTDFQMNQIRNRLCLPQMN
jgi:protein tyrosine/serine phosphatase